MCVACVRIAVAGMTLVLSSDEEAIAVRRNAELGADIVWVCDYEKKKKTEWRNAPDDGTISKHRDCVCPVSIYLNSSSVYTVICTSCISWEL